MDSLPRDGFELQVTWVFTFGLLRSKSASINHHISNCKAIITTTTTTTWINSLPSTTFVAHKHATSLPNSTHFCVNLVQVSRFVPLHEPPQLAFINWLTNVCVRPTHIFHRPFHLSQFHLAWNQPRVLLCSFPISITITWVCSSRA